MAAVEKKAQSWQLLESLRGERILHGISQDCSSAVDHNQPRPSRSWSIVSISGSPPVLHSPSRFKHVTSDESVLSPDSLSTFRFDIPTSPNSSTSSERRNTVPGDQLCCHGKSNSLPKQRHSAATVPPMQSPVFHPKATRTASAPVTGYPLWQRTASLTTLAERHYDASPLLENFKSRLVGGQRGMTRSCLSITNSNHSDFSTSDSSQRLQIADLSSCPMEDNDSDSITDDGGSIAPVSALTPPMSERSMNISDTSSELRQKQCQTGSQPLSFRASSVDVAPASPSEFYLEVTSPNSTLSWNEIPNSASPECCSRAEHGSRQSGHQVKPRVLLNNEKEDASNSLAEKNLTSRDSSLSLMSEIIQELKRSSQNLQKNFDNKSDVPATKAGLLPNSPSGWPRFVNGSSSDHWHKSISRRSSATVQLARIHEDNEERFEETETFLSSTYSGLESFTRNSNLRKSKSSFELSFHQRQPPTKPLSPLITNLQRTVKHSGHSLSSSATYTELKSRKDSLSSEKSPSHHTKKLNFRQDAKSVEERKGKDYKKKTKAVGANHSHPRRGFLNLFKGKWFSMDNVAGAHLGEQESLHDTPIKLKVPNSEKTRRYLVVLPTPHNNTPSPAVTNGLI